VPRRFQFQQRVLFEGTKRPQMGGGFRPAKFSPGGDVQDLPTEPPIAEERVDVVVVRGAAVPELPPGELVVPDLALCSQCHNDESPTYVAFDPEKMLKAIAHLHPLREKPRVSPPKKKESEK